jgi:hypothetical protein
MPAFLKSPSPSPSPSDRATLSYYRACVRVVAAAKELLSTSQYSVNLSTRVRKLERAVEQADRLFTVMDKKR